MLAITQIISTERLKHLRWMLSRRCDDQMVEVIDAFLAERAERQEEADAREAKRDQELDDARMAQVHADVMIERADYRVWRMTQAIRRYRNGRRANVSPSPCLPSLAAEVS